MTSPFRPIALALSLLATHAGLAEAQHPFEHYTEGIAARYSVTQPAISYTIRVDSTDLSAVGVEVRVRDGGPVLRLGMAAHPEYDDRYYRHVEDVRARSGTQRLSVTREDSAIWRIPTANGNATVSYRIRLPTPAESPRAAWRPFLSPTGGMLGGPHTLMFVIGATLAPVHVTLEMPRSWDVATALERTVDSRTFFAPTADVLIDSPILVGSLRMWTFEAEGVPHHIAYWPQPGARPFDTTGVRDGIRRLVNNSIALFGRAPYRDYTFLVQDNAYGGLEHRGSVTLGARSDDLAEHIDEFLQDAAHEYFHTWNLMRIRPAEYGDVSVRPPPPVAELWFSEGLTMFYADVLLRKSGIPTDDSSRVAHVAALVQRYLAFSGNTHFSAEQISRAEYSGGPGALGDYVASVHLVGELLGIVLDLRIRDATQNRRSMDDVMRAMFVQYSGRRGFTSADVERVAGEVCRCALRDVFALHVRGATPIDLSRTLALAGLSLRTTWTPALDRNGRPAPDFRLRARTVPGQRTSLIVMGPETVWGRAGLHTGDDIVSLNGRAIAGWPELRRALSGVAIGDSLRLEIVRAGVPRQVAIVMRGYDQPSVQIGPVANPTPRQRALLDAWRRAAEPPVGVRSP